MSVWKSNFFLQAGLPESLPKPPERDPAADSEFAVENGLTTRRVGQRGKDKLPRKTRGPTLFNFFEAMRTLETREESGDGNVSLKTTDIHLEYYALTQQQRMAHAVVALLRACRRPRHAVQLQAHPRPCGHCFARF